MTDDAFEPTKTEDIIETAETHDEAGDDETVEEGSLLGNDALVGDTGHASDDEHGTVGEDA